MFSIIITLVAIALVALIALAALYYGTSAWTSGDARAVATKYTTEAEQIQAAILLYQQDNAGDRPKKLTDLTDNGTYLAAAPSDFWKDNSAFILTDGGDVSEDVCRIFNSNRGIHTTPTCEDPLYRGAVVCCQVTQ